MHTQSTQSFDLIIAGTGSMGAAAAYYAAKSGWRTLALEQFSATPHDKGSHAGQSRIIRKAYFEHPDYVPLLESAYRSWKEFEEETGEELFVRSGLIYCGAPDHAVMKGVRYASSAFGIPLNELNSFLHFTINGHQLLFEPDAGFVLPERSIGLFTKEAMKNGATIHTGEKMLGWEDRGDHILVSTDKNEYSCAKLIITAGAWAGKILQDLHLPLKVTRQLIVWVSPQEPEQFLPENFPCWMIAENERPGVLYGFPYLDAHKYPGPSGLKFAWHHAAEETDPDKVNRDISVKEVNELIERVGEYFPAAKGKLVEAKTCLYTNTPDENFIIDHLPGNDNKVVIACGFSGHGFKFVPEIGKIVVEMAINGRSELPVDFLSLKRFSF